ncbi:MAG TPA: hypothetical protein VGM06_12590 [Polyangiaceae bacterium]
MGTNTPKNNRRDLVSADQALADGLGKHASAITSIVIGGVSQTTADIVAVLQARIDSANAAQTTWATWRNAVAADRAERTKTQAYVSGVKQALLVAFTGQVDALADFGMTPRKPRVVTPEEKVTAAAKAKATRAARHTMGKKQKAAIKGALPPTDATPEAPASPSPAPAPAGSTTVTQSS